MTVRILVLVITLASVTAASGRQTATSTLPGDDLGEFSGGLGQTISADGRYTTRATPQGLHLVDVTTPAETLVRAVESRRERIRLYPAASAISPDGSRIAFYQTTGNTSELRIIARDGRDERIVLSSDQHAFHPADWSPNGASGLVIIRGKQHDSLCLLPVRDSACRTLVESQPLRITRARFSPTGAYVAYTLVAASGADDAGRDVTLFYIPEKGAGFNKVEIEGRATDLLGWTPDAGFDRVHALHSRRC
jgi:dipeptidyl aminopeptidase/acylaminoacyl peptidase